jgi:hypothetical protein
LSVEKIERERDWYNVVDDCIEPLGASICRRTNLEAKNALIEIWQEINYNYYLNPLISVTA